jgi:ankyrin repeat protein
MAKGWKPTAADLVTAYEAKAWNIIRLLLMAGVPIATNIQDSIIDEAAKNGQLEVVKLLMANPKIDLSGLNHTNYPLRLAAEKGHHAVMRQLLTDPRVDPNVAIQDYHSNRYDAEALRILALDPKTSPFYQQTVLYLAALNGYTPLVRELLGLGIPPDADTLEAANMSKNPETIAVVAADPRVY